MKVLLVVCFLSIFVLSGYAQHARLIGAVSDTAENHPLGKAVITLVQQKDSFLVAFTRADDKGAFSFHKLPAGKMIFKVSYPAYADYVSQFELTDSTDMNLQTIPMIRKSKLLQEVVVHGNMGAIRMKGDTLEFKADSFKVQQGASVEELLRKLPGIQVDHNGKITAQGETVKKVLVDGEEFFGDDPTLVTQNLRAEMIDKVQVFDKKSDQAAFTGIDDGEKNKTINLQLKENKKKGYFGKVEAGLGNNGFFNNQAMLNYFKNKLKISVYGIWSNTGKTGLNWQESEKFGQSFASGADYDETSGYFSFNGNSDELESWGGQYGGQGLPEVKTGGLHFNDKWNADRQSVNGNYKVLDLDITGTSGTRTQYQLPDTTYYNNQSEQFHNHITRNKVNGIYEFTIDSTSSIKLNVDGSVDHKVTQSAFTSDYLQEDSSLVNRNNRTISTAGDIRNLNSNLIYKKKFRKKGRTLSFNLREDYSDDNSTGYLRSDTRYYSRDSVLSEQLVDQYKKFSSSTLLLDGRLTYTEPLSAVSTISLNYGLSGGNSHSQRNSFNNNGVGKYNDPDSLYSNDYRFSLFTQKTGLLYNYNGLKFSFNAGNNIGFTGFRQNNLDSNLLLTRNFVNWYPQAQATYKFTQSSFLRLWYNGRTNQPTIAQLQPLANNQDPLNIYVGNPDLKPEFRNNVSLRYNNFKQLSERYLFVRLSVDKTENAIGTRNDVDDLGRRVNQSVNLNGNFSVEGNVDYQKKLKIGKFDLNAGVGGNASVNRYLNIVNGVLNQTDQKNYGFSFNFYKSKEKKYEFQLYGGPTYTTSVSSIRDAINTHYWTFSANPSVDIFLPLKFQVHTDADFELRQKTSTFDKSFNTVFWNAWIGKKFFKADNLLLKLQGNDLLNQNIGFNRSVNSNFISQNTYTTIRRYLMLSIVWNFTKAGGAAPKTP